MEGAKLTAIAPTYPDLSVAHRDHRGLEGAEGRAGAGAGWDLPHPTITQTISTNTSIRQAAAAALRDVRLRGHAGLSGALGRKRERPSGFSRAATCADLPDLDVTFLDYPDLIVNEYGARGIGEIGMAGAAPAITAAVYHATGVRVRELPVRIEDLLKSTVEA